MKKERSEREIASAFVLTTIMLAVLCGFAAMAFDLGRTYVRKRQMFFAADAGTIAGVAKLIPTITDPSGVAAMVADAEAEAASIAATNGLASPDIVIESGNWNPANNPKFDDYPTDPSVDPYNAIKISGASEVDSVFAQVIGVSALFPSVDSIAVGESNIICMKPFGVEIDTLEPGGVPLQPGDKFEVSGQSEAGNWGKLDIGGNMSSGNNFEDAMLGSGACDAGIGIGNSMEPGTGFGGPIGQIFDDIIADPDYSVREMTLAVVDNFVQGNHPVVLMNFLRARLTPTYCCNYDGGAGFEAEFEVIEYPVDPGTLGGSGQRVLVQ